MPKQKRRFLLKCSVDCRKDTLTEVLQMLYNLLQCNMRNTCRGGQNASSKRNMEKDRHKDKKKKDVLKKNNSKIKNNIRKNRKQEY